MSPFVTRTACVWCADWPVVVARVVTALGGGPVVVTERIGAREVVRAASEEARADGVTLGMRRREAEAACPGVQVVPADPIAEARWFEPVARALETITPRFEIVRPGLVTFPTSGPARYHGGDDQVAARAREAVAGVLVDGLGAGERTARVGVADSRFAATLAARRAMPVLVIPRGEAARFLARFPVEVLGDEHLAALLVRLGLPTLGAFAELPTDAVLARFGVDGRRRHALARGFDDTPPILVEAPADLVAATQFEPPIDRVDAAAFAAKALADELVGALGALGLACTRVLVEAETEFGERLSRWWRHESAFDARQLSDRVRWQLEGWLAAARRETASPDARVVHDDAALAEAGIDSLTGALVGLRLVPDEVVAAPARQLGFWRGDAAAADQADRALARVQGMLGYDAVGTVVIRGGRTPAERMQWVPWGEPREVECPGVAAGWPGAVPGPAPARVFDPPLPVELLDAGGAPVRVSGRGVASAAPSWVRGASLMGGGGPVVAWAGPWPYDVRWWDPHAHARGARWQMTVETRKAGIVACLVTVVNGIAAIEAIYD